MWRRHHNETACGEDVAVCDVQVRQVGGHSAGAAALVVFTAALPVRLCCICCKPRGVPPEKEYSQKEQDTGYLPRSTHQLVPCCKRQAPRTVAGDSGALRGKTRVMFWPRESFDRNVLRFKSSLVVAGRGRRGCRFKKNA